MKENNSTAIDFVFHEDCSAWLLQICGCWVRTIWNCDTCWGLLMKKITKMFRIVNQDSQKVSYAKEFKDGYLADARSILIRILVSSPGVIGPVLVQITSHVLLRRRHCSGKSPEVSIPPRPPPPLGGHCMRLITVCFIVCSCIGIQTESMHA